MHLRFFARRIVIRECVVSRVVERVGWLGRRTRRSRMKSCMRLPERYQLELRSDLRSTEMTDVRCVGREMTDVPCEH